MKLKFPGFKILDRYIIGKFLGTYLFAIAMIIIVVVIFDYVEKIDDFTQLHAPFKAIIFDYYLNFIPFFINQFQTRQMLIISFMEYYFYVTDCIILPFTINNNQFFIQKFLLILLCTIQYSSSRIFLSEFHNLACNPP